MLFFINLVGNIGFDEQENIGEGVIVENVDGFLKLTVVFHTNQHLF